jgi:hypothetical protein
MVMVPVRKARRQFSQGIVIVAILGVASHGFVAAQEVKKVKVPLGGAPLPKVPLAKEAVPLQIPVAAILKGGAVAPADRNMLQKYLDAHLDWFKAPANQTGLWRIRGEFRNFVTTAGRAPNKAAHTWLTDYLLAEMQKLINDDKQSSTVRVNAVVVINDLDLTGEGLAGAAKEPAVPLPAALPVLLRIFQDTKLPLGIRATALAGLHRHATLGIADKKMAAQLRTLMLTTLNDKNVPKNCDQAAHEWVRRRAAETLAVFKDIGMAANTTEVMDAITAVLNDKDASVVFRAEAACTLDQFTFPQGAKIDYQALANRLGVLALDVLDSPTDRAIVVEHLTCVRTGLAGKDLKKATALQAAAAGNADAVKFITELSKQVKDSSDVISKKVKHDSQLAEIAEIERRKIQQLVKTDDAASDEPPDFGKKVPGNPGTKKK